MRRRHRPTGCAKFFLVILIVAPLAFIGASLYTGKNPIDSFYEILGIESKEEIQSEEEITTDEVYSENAEEKSADQKKVSADPVMQQQISELEKNILRLEAQKDYLEEELKKCRENK